MVEKGLVRAYGVCRSAPDLMSRDAYREHLQDAELWAAAEGVGARADTDLSKLRGEPAAQGQADSELDLATAKATPTEYPDINTVARDELMRIPGIGGHLANLIIGNRRYDSLDRHRSKRYSWSAPGFPNTPPQLPLGDAGTVRTIALQLAMWVQTDQTRRNETSARP